MALRLTCTELFGISHDAGRATVGDRARIALMAISSVFTQRGGSVSSESFRVYIHARIGVTAVHEQGHEHQAWGRGEPFATGRTCRFR